MSKSNEQERWAKIAGLPKKETKQQLDENFVGMGAINQIFPTREPQKYELAFEHYLGEVYDSKKESLGDKWSTFSPDDQMALLLTAFNDDDSAVVVAAFPPCILIEPFICNVAVDESHANKPPPGTDDVK